MSAPTYRLSASGGLEFNAINIELWGFKKCPLVSPDVVAGALACLPPHQLEGLKKIRYEDVPWVPGISRWLRIPGLSRLKGRYDVKESSIVLHACASRAELFRALFHEVGHFVYFRIISSFDKKRWVTGVSRAEPEVSRYGGRNAAEDFAEAFASFALHAGSLAGLPGKERFMAEIVFRGLAPDHATLRALVQGSVERAPAHLDRYI